jgi:hypothetical protein
MLELTVISFALWTLLCNLVVLNGGNLHGLVIAFASTPLFIIPLLILRWRQGGSKRVPRGKAHGDYLNEAAWIFALCIAMALTLTLIRPDAGDAFYVNMAVGAVDNPSMPLLCRDTMHHLTGAPILLPFYRIHSIELLAALLSLITGASAIFFLHVVFPPLAAITALLAYRSLFRRFSPGFWGFATLATCLFLCANGDVHASFGNLSWVRLHQGKGILVTTVIPIIIDATLAFSTKPSSKSLLYLSASQIAAVGMSGSALMIGPLMSLLSASACLSIRDSAVKPRKVLPGVMAACLYPLAVAVFFFLQSRPSAKASMTAGSDIILNNIQYVFGSGPFAYACVAVMACVPLLASHPVARRLGICCSLFALLIVSNPMVAPFLAEQLSMSAIFWRFYWLVPLPLFAGLFCCIPLECPQLRAPRWTGFVVYASVLLLLLAVLPQKRIFDKTNQTTIGAPGLKVPSFYEDIMEIAAHFGSQDSILMPAELSPWLTTIHHAPRPVLSRLSYAPLYPASIRGTLCSAQLYISEDGRTRGSGEALSSLLQTMEVQGVCFSGNLDNAADIAYILQRRGYRRVDRFGSTAYELYVRNPS